jgi:hypothetical protein
MKVVAVSDATREIEYTASLDRAALAGARVRFEWQVLKPFENEVDEDRLEFDDVGYDDAEKGRRVAHSFRRGARIAWRVSHTSGSPSRTVVSPIRRSVLE